MPCGLGARDTLRLEAKMALYGNDIDETVTACEADLGWIVKMGKGDFLGRDALAAQKAAGVPRKLVGFEMVDRGIARHGYPAKTAGRRRGRDVGHAFADARQAHRPGPPAGRRGRRRDGVRGGHPRARRGRARRADTVLQEEGKLMDDLHYSESHEWVRVDGDIGTIGITDHAQKQLGEIVYLELPEVGHVYNADDEFGTVESVKAVSELYIPVSGEVVEVNKARGLRARHHQRRSPGRRLAHQGQALDRRGDRQADVGRGLRGLRARGRAGEVKFLPQSDAERREMLAAIGVASIDDLFAAVPAAVRQAPDLPDPLSEIEIRRFLGGLAAKNANARETAFFLGGGVYNHYVSAIADQMLYRAEWLTSYTPYQPEVSQGTLQSIFEFQTHVCLLTGLEVANASLYEGASALVEALLMAERLSQGQEARGPFGRDPPRVPGDGAELLREPGPRDRRGAARRRRRDRPEGSRRRRRRDDFRGGRAVAQLLRNRRGLGRRLGRGEDVRRRCRSRWSPRRPRSRCSRLRGREGADIACGELQSLGVPMHLGGPLLGFLACRTEHQRQIPGRLVGETRDAEGRRAFCLTLSTREQHIRREKATSNICTNQGLMALASNIHMSLLGKKGLREVALQSHAKAEYLKGGDREDPGLPDSVHGADVQRVRGRGAGGRAPR